MFKKLAEKSEKHQKYCFWQNEYHPIELSDNQMMLQKLDYIHENPVKAGYVLEPECWRYSSAVDYTGGKGLFPTSAEVTSVLYAPRQTPLLAHD